MSAGARPIVCIAHQTVLPGDAIGHDICGMYRLLERCGYAARIVCENVHAQLAEDYVVHCGPDVMAACADADLLIFHHSIHWPAGEALVARFPRQVVVKYHNVTPGEFFAPYCELYKDVCDGGRAQTARMAAMTSIARWQCDSTYNALEVGKLGVPGERRGVVPPFTRCDDIFRDMHEARYAGGRFNALFVGRRAPNKGHAHILRTLAAWRDLFPESELRCRIVGSVDANLAGYYEELTRLERSLRLRGRVEWLQHVSDADLADLFRGSHVYLNLSEHEGFCVPLIESQALGLPVVSTNVTALEDTAGPGQLMVPLPRGAADYDMIAGLLHELCVSEELRRSVVRAGCDNVYRRFTSHVIEDTFLADLEPVLRRLEA